MDTPDTPSNCYLGWVKLKGPDLHILCIRLWRSGNKHHCHLNYHFLNTIAGKYKMAISKGASQYSSNSKKLKAAKQCHFIFQYYSETRKAFP